MHYNDVILVSNKSFSSAGKYIVSIYSIQKHRTKSKTNRTSVHSVYSRAHSLHVHSTTIRKMKSLKWFYLQLIYLAVVKLGSLIDCLILGCLYHRFYIQL